MFDHFPVHIWRIQNWSWRTTKHMWLSMTSRPIRNCISSINTRGSAWRNISTDSNMEPETLEKDSFWKSWFFRLQPLFFGKVSAPQQISPNGLVLVNGDISRPNLQETKTKEKYGALTTILMVAKQGLYMYACILMFTYVIWIRRSHFQYLLIYNSSWPISQSPLIFSLPLQYSPTRKEGIIFKPSFPRVGFLVYWLTGHDIRRLEAASDTGIVSNQYQSKCSKIRIETNQLFNVYSIFASYICFDNRCLIFKSHVTQETHQSHPHPSCVYSPPVQVKVGWAMHKVLQKQFFTTPELMCQTFGSH